MPKLGVNIDHVATLRQLRKTRFPNPVEAAQICERAGADGITVHLREDRRHIQDADVQSLKKNIRTKLNLEMAVTEEMIGIARHIKPHSVCFVPEKRQEVTTEGGLDVVSHQRNIEEAIRRLNDAQILVSLFIDPDPKQIEASKMVGAHMVEIHTGRYCDAIQEKKSKELDLLFSAIHHAHELGLMCNAGHGLDYTNILPLAKHPNIYEFNIGHSIVCRAVWVGLDQAVQEMKRILS